MPNSQTLNALYQILIRGFNLPTSLPIPNLMKVPLIKTWDVSQSTSYS